MSEIKSIPNEQKPSGKKTKGGKPVDIKKEIISWVLTLAAAVVIALIIRHFVFEPVRVEGSSMLSTLADGEIMFVTKPEYLLGEPQRGDVIICRYPDRDPYFVKRLIALPGDTIEIRGGTVYVNEEMIEEPYLDPARNRYSHNMERVTLGDNQYFVMGDNRDNSNDSRSAHVGPISREQIIGHVRFVVFPFNAARGVE